MRILLFSMGLFALLIIFFSIPSVQTYIADKVTSSLNEQYGTDIQVSKIRVKYNGNALLKEVYIADHQGDTLIYATTLETGLLSIRSLLNNKMELSSTKLDQAKVYVRRYKDEERDNLSIFAQKFNTGKPVTTPFRLNAVFIELKNSRFKYTDENLDSPEVIDYRNLNLGASDFLLDDVTITTHIEDLQFDAVMGYNLRGLEADFRYNPDEIVLQEMTLKTENSFIKGHLKLDTRNDAFADFYNLVKIDFKFKEADLSTTDLKTFYSEFGPGQRIRFSGKMEGTLNDFELLNLDMQGLNTSRIRGDIRFQDLLSEEDKFTITGNYRQLKTSYLDLIALLPDLLGKNLPAELRRLGNVDLSGRIRVTENSVYAQTNVLTDIGSLQTDLDLTNIRNIDRAGYKGTLKAERFNIGRLTGIQKLGNITFSLNVDGTGMQAENLNTRINGEISRLTYQGYTYQGILVSGNLQYPLFNGNLEVNDPNSQLTFNGLVDFSKAINKYDFTADMEYVNLARLNFLKDTLAVLKGRVVMDMQGTTVDDATGSIRFSDASFQNPNDLYTFDDFRITSSFTDSIRTIKMDSPDIISGEVSGKFKIKDVVPLFRNAVGSLYANYEPETITSDQFMDFDLQIYSKIVEVFVPQIELEPDTYVRGRVVSDESEFKLTFRSPRIKAFGILAEAINIKVDNKNPLFNTYIEADSIGSGLYGLSDFNLINVTLKDTLFMRSEFRGGPQNKDEYDLNFYHTINPDNKSVVGFSRSGIKFKDNQWYLNENDNNQNKIVFDNDFRNIDIEELILSHDEERISLKGQLLDSTYKNIRTDFNQVRLSHITPYIDSLDLEGIVNGSLNFLQEGGAYFPESAITVDAFTINDILMGDLQLSVQGNRDLTAYSIDTRLVNEDFEALTATGAIDVSTGEPSIDMDVRMRRLNLAAFSPLGGEVISSIRGLASGRARVTGSYKNPDIDGEILLRNAGLRIPYLNTDYNFKGTSRVVLSDQEFRFSSVDLVDTKYKTEGTLSGTISHQSFSEWNMDLAVNTDRLVALDTEEDEFALYYGTAFISGEATIKGPTDELVIDVVATTEKGTVFKIPLSDTESFGDSSVIYFLSPEEKQARLEGEVIVVEELKGLELNFDLEITRDAEVEIVVDKTNGSTLRGRGAGYLLIQINTNGKFNMFGDFTPYEGTYNFRYSGVVQKQFDILPEGKISWDGNPTDALLDISAVYRTQANPSVLLENPSINRKIPVNVIINLDGQLMQPDITFDFEFPNTSSIVTSELNYRLDERSIRELQAFSLVTQGSFYSQNAMDGQAVVTGNLIETASGIFNDILADEDGKFSVGLDFVQADRNPQLQTQGRFGFTLSTQISNRVIINGKVGVPVGGVSESAVVGDVEVNFLLNEEGTLRATIFNRQTDIQFIVRDNDGYTQGAGLTYSVDFSTFKELLRKIFAGRVREVENEIRIIQPDSEIPYEGY